MANSPAPSGPMQLAATWDMLAASYAVEIPQQMSPFVDEALRVAELLSSDDVLDVAAGPGTLALRAAPLCRRAVAVDFSPGMIEEVARDARRRQLDNVTAAVMDAQDLGFEDDSFDAAFCMFGFMFFPDRSRAFREILRVLRPGGRAVIATWGPIERRPMMKVGFDAMAATFPDLPRPAKGDLQSPEECEREMTDAGFAAVRAAAFTASARFEAEQYVRSIVRAGPIAVLQKRLGEEAWRAAEPTLLLEVAKHIPEGGADLAAEAIITRGVAR